MDYKVLLEKGTGKRADKLSLTQMKIEHDKNGKGLTFLKKGQQITGIVDAVNDQITLNFSGQKVTTSKDVLKNAVVGEMKTFEVVKADDNEIELRLLDGSASSSRQTFKAALIKETDWKSILDQKKQKTKHTEKEKEAQEKESKLKEIGSKLTERDYGQLEQEGFTAESLSVDGLYSALNRIKKSTAQKEQKVAEKMKSFTEDELSERLKAKNLPVTAENLGNITKALELSDTAAKIDDKAMRYLISQGVEPTIENIYKAYYSGNERKQEQPQELSSKTWSELETQVKDVIGAAGYEINNENLADAKWLLENKLPLTEETFAYKKELEEIKGATDKDIVLDKIIEGMRNGGIPKDVSLASEDLATQEHLITSINSIEKDTITQAVRQDAELTIKRLLTIQGSLGSGKIIDETNASDAANATTISNETSNVNATVKTTDYEVESANITEAELAETDLSEGASTDTENDEMAVVSEKNFRYEEAKAQRQLEEIRLKMTLEAAAKLEKQGFHIETQKLEKVVEALRDLEDGYYKELLKEADTEVSEFALQTLKETTQSLEQLKYTSSYVLGSTLSERSNQTITSLLTEGGKLQADLAKAGAAYETLMTTPNKEYGDSIRKAFANMDSLLSEMKTENTEQNQRAVRILGYNQMEITEDQINRVKAYDLEVTSMMQNLQPAVTVRMIKEGINPLTMPMNELNSTIDRIKEEQGISSEEKFSTYLRKIEKENGITQEERKAYIGIYRLLYNVEKSDGAALGAVIKADREVTLENLLTAIQTGKKGRLDAVIDDEFGTLQSISHDKETITEQLSSFSGGAGQQNAGQPSDDGAMKEQTEYLNRILKLMKEEMAPDKLQEVGQNLANSGTPLEQSSIGITPLLSSDKSIWETVKAVPVEKLLEQLRNTEAAQTAQAEEIESYTEKVQEIRELCKNSEASIRFLSDYHVPSTPTNIMLANHILSNGDTLIKRLLKRQNEKIVENSQSTLKEMTNLSDTLIDKSSMNEAYAKLEANAKATLEQGYSEEKIDSRKLAELKSIGQQMTFLRTLAEKEFYQIPIETDNGITNMNLTILRGAESTGKVSVTIWSEQLGNIKAEFSLKDQTLKGFISCDNRSGLQELQRNAGQIEIAAQENAVTLKQMDFGVQRKEKDTYSYQNPENDAQKSSTGNDTERILYRVAKAIIQTVRLAEQNGVDTDQIVS
ncbi:MAG: hypothetical protein K0S01_2008 [Herbinix sp.]|jgi:hypothetical protein|nr:hypothetical protein [Herbinix sp.]